MAELTQWAWVIWLVLIALFLVIEMFTLEFTFLMLGLGSVAGLISSAFGIPFWGQAIVAAVVAFILLFTVRPPLLKRFRRGEQKAKFGTQSLPGMSGIATQNVTPFAGEVKLDNGDVWTARVRPQDGEIPAGTPIMVQTVDGAIVRVTTVPTSQANQKESA